MIDVLWSDDSLQKNNPEIATAMATLSRHLGLICAERPLPPFVMRLVDEKGPHLTPLWGPTPWRHSTRSPTGTNHNLSTDLIGNAAFAQSVVFARMGDANTTRAGRKPLRPE